MQNVEWDFGMFQLKIKAIDGIFHYSGPKRGSIPVDSVSGIQYESMFLIGYITFLASGANDGKIQVPAGIKSKEIVNDINDYIREYKQEKSQKSTIVSVPQQLSVADELLKLKSLLDAGVITQEEFETQKVKILSR